MRSHISFSELKIWNDCPYKHKLTYVDGIKKFVGSEHTAFGTTMHYVCEKLLEENNNELNLYNIFETRFLEELKLLTEKNVKIKKDLIEQMREQGKNMISFILPSLKETFVKFEIVSIEEELLLPTDNNEHTFKGFIDLVLKTPDNKYHVIDWKTCSWGWDSKRKSDRMTTYQLTLYKYFFAKKYNINLGDIETYFALLKRTAKNENVEIFRVTSGPKKINNSLKLLDKAIYNIKKGNFIKNRLACTAKFGCEFYKTKHCR